MPLHSFQNMMNKQKSVILSIIIYLYGDERVGMIKKLSCFMTQITMWIAIPNQNFDDVGTQH